MLNQFFNYVTNLIIEYFKHTKIQPGDRFYLQVDHEEDVESIVHSISCSGSEKFIYQHQQGPIYETIALRMDKTLLVVAYTSASVDPDFLVTLRNQVGEQQGVWENTALLNIVSKPKDSISGGSCDLQKEGMPLHPKTFVNRLETDIEKNIPSKVERIILTERMKQILNELAFHQVTFFDFEEIFAAVARGQIDGNEYRQFGLFKDTNLNTFEIKEVRKRLELNRELFDYVRKYHELGYDQELLDNRISSKYAKGLKDSDWEQVDFTDVKKGYDYAIQSKVGNVVLNEIKSLDKLKMWNKPHKETSAGLRKRHIILFNPSHLSQIQIQVNFTLEGSISSLNSEYLNIDKGSRAYTNVSVGRVNLTIKVDTIKSEARYCKISYQHEHRTALGCELNIAVMPIDAPLFKNFETSYWIDVKKHSIVTSVTGDKQVIGDGLQKNEIEITKDQQEIEIIPENIYELTTKSEVFNDDNELCVKLKYTESNQMVSVIYKNENPETVPITSVRISKLKREERLSFKKFEGIKKLVFGNREFYVSQELNEFLEYEQAWLNGGIKSAKLVSGTLVPEDIELSLELREAYNRFVNKFRILQSIPSLAYMDESISTAALDYVMAYMDEIQKIPSGIAVGKSGLDLFKLGIIHAHEEIYFTPYHPLNVAYQLELNQSLQSENVENAILTRLRPDSLVPYIYVNQKGLKEELYKSDIQNTAIEWIQYKPVKKVSVSDANKYLDRVIEDKLVQFERHFSYMFHETNHSPIKVNIINIENDHQVVVGILSWIIEKIRTVDLSAIRPIEITIYRENSFESSFDLLSRTQTPQEFYTNFNIDLSKFDQYDPTDVLREIHQSVVFYKKSDTSVFDYAHISYYRMNQQEKYAIQPVNDMTTGVSLRGLFSVIPSMKGIENYKTGFGMKDYLSKDDEVLVNVSVLINELAANLKNEGNDSYHKGEVIFARTTAAEEDFLNHIFAASHWVTFIDSNLDLEYFNNLNDNLVVIHYNDQYSASNKYDAITVTNKSNQYFQVINETLDAKGVQVTSNDTALNTIKAFNTFNGEWLLRIVGSKGHYAREKLSIISAIKFALAYFDHPNIKWVPISLEEILRVAGSVSLNKSDGLFTTKNLGIKGSHSDDLLLMGIEEANSKLVIHFYPVEVKIGVNNKPVLDKAKVQVNKTRKLFNDALCNMEKPFASRFYRYFFAQLYLINALKLHHGGFWPEKDYNIKSVIIKKLLSNEIVILSNMDKILGEGAVLSFQTGAIARESVLFEGVTYLNLPESDGYNGLVKTMQETYEWIQNKPNDFIKERMLSYIYQSDYTDIEIEQDPFSGALLKVEPFDSLLTVEKKATYDVNIYKVVDEVKGNTSFQQEALEKDSDQEGNDKELEEGSKELLERNGEETQEKEVKTYESIKSQDESAQIEQIRIMIGTAENSTKKIYWEYGNIGLANRHLLISGKSGQGKTYFMQCLLLEMSKQNLSSIVVDYTEGFLPNQLESEFKDYLGEKLIQQIVFTQKLPLNPFKRNIRDIGGVTLPESDTDVAERIKSVFASVYSSLGIQQQNAIYEAVLKGMEKHDDNMNLDCLKDLLEQDGSNYAKTALSQIKPFIDRRVFSQEGEFSWKDILEGQGLVFIIQLTGYPRDVQLIITEFILWDLWNYNLRFGDKLKPCPVILDEAQNLDHTEQSPSAKILTEGRKFGWSGWYATQFLKSQLGNDELARLQNSSQKVYFAQPEQEITYIASNLTTELSERKRLETRISNLKKGQCLVHGPIVNEQGQLTPPNVVCVNIIPLAQRI